MKSLGLQRRSSCTWGIGSRGSTKVAHRDGRSCAANALPGRSLLFAHLSSLYGFTVTDAMTEELSRYAGQINAWFSRGRLKGRIARTLPLSQTAWAYQLPETKSLFGKLVLVPD
jgi:NADPH:quinone reductase-like Zn-dependent oxidoreductase